LSIGYWLLAIGYCLLAIGYWLLAIGYWLLAIVYWLLAIGYWLLAVGYWLLAIVAASRFSVAHLQALVAVELHPLRLVRAFVKASDWQAGHEGLCQKILVFPLLSCLCCVRALRPWRSGGA
jgi:hypothetical protein